MKCLFRGTRYALLRIVPDKYQARFGTKILHMHAGHCLELSQMCADKCPIQMRMFTKSPGMKNNTFVCSQYSVNIFWCANQLFILDFDGLLTLGLGRFLI